MLVNVAARELGLGSGGFDVLYANLTRGVDLPGEPGAHVMKLPYTPLQVAALHAEEEGGLAAALGEMPVVCCSLHSQVAPVCAGIGEGVRVAYLQLPGARCRSPSDTVRALKERGLVEVTVAVGACVDGDVACVSIASGLAWAAARGFSVVVCGIGPGSSERAALSVTAGLAAADAANAASALGGRPILAVRISGADARARHQGVSHHTRSVLDLCLGEVVCAWPAGSGSPEGLEPHEYIDVSGWREATSGLPLEHMGRGPDDDPSFFAAAYAAGKLARSRIEA